MTYIYNIEDFFWNAEYNAFYANSWNLRAILPDTTMHPETFPNGKEKFRITNPKTGGFREFKFLKEETVYYVDIEDDHPHAGKDLIFESEDGIRCIVYFANNNNQ